MPSLRQGDRPYFLNLEAGKVLTVSADVASSVIVRTYPTSQGAQSDGQVAISAGASQPWGPYLVATRYAIEVVAGNAMYAIGDPTRDQVSIGAAPGNQTVIADASITLAQGINSISSAAGGATKIQLAVPSTGGGEFRVRNADRKSDTAVYIQHQQPAVRLSNSGSSIVLPSVTLPATADVGWTVAALVRVHSVNTQSGTTHYAFLKIGSGSAYFLLGYEGPNASNPGCLKCLMPNAAATGLSSVRSNSSPTPAFAAFASSQLGQWIWVFVRKHGAQLVENVLSLSTGAETSATFSDETVTLAWAPVLPASATGTQVYAGSTGIASGAYSAPSAALTVGPDASTTGTCDIAKVMVVNQVLTQAQMRDIAKGYRPQDLGITVSNANDVYYDFTSTTASELLDLLGGTAATSVTLAGGDAATPVANRPTVLQYIGNTGAAGGWLQGGFADGTGYKDGALA